MVGKRNSEISSHIKDEEENTLDDDFICLF